MTEDTMPPKHRLTETHEHIARVGHILTGRAIPSTDELLRLMPFFGGNLPLDILNFARRELRRFEQEEVPDEQKITTAKSLIDAVGNVDVSEQELADFVGRMMDALPEEDRDGRLRCRIYRAALGDRPSRLSAACDAVSILSAQAQKGEEPTLADITLAWTAHGWLAGIAADDLFEPLSGHPKPENVGQPVDTALLHGRTLLMWLLGDAWPKVPPRRMGNPG
jgi:hypothetical protein